MACEPILLSKMCSLIQKRGWWRFQKRATYLLDQGQVPDEMGEWAEHLGSFSSFRELKRR
jgi:hypothetical protein